MKTPSKILFFLASIVAMSACEPAGRGGTVVLDLNAIARATGQDEVLRQQVAAATGQLNAQLGEIAADLEAQLVAERERLGAEADPDAAQRLEALTVQARQQLSQTQQLAVQRARAFETGLVQALLDQVRPVAAEIARRRGADAVLLAEAQLLWFDPARDITGAVIDELRARGIEPLRVPEAAVPPAEAPGAGAAEAPAG